MKNWDLELDIAKAKLRRQIDENALFEMTCFFIKEYGYAPITPIAPIKSSTTVDEYFSDLNKLIDITHSLTGIPKI